MTAPDPPRAYVAAPAAEGRPFRVRGELDIATGPAVCRAIRTLALAGDSELLLDLSEVSFIDVSGLRALVGAGAGAALAGRSPSLVITAPSACVRLLLRVCDLEVNVRP